MPYAKPTQIKAWSYSRYGTYAACPLKAKLTILDKIQEPKNDAMTRGNDIHKAIEGVLKGTITKIPKELAIVADLLKRIKAYQKKHPDRVIIEESWAYREDWSETTYDDWNGCWVRIKLDLAMLLDGDTGPIVEITDWKSGKFRPNNIQDYVEQLDLYALGAFMKWRHLLDKGLEIHPRLVYVDTPVIYPNHETDPNAKVYKAEDFPRLKKEWEKRVKPMLNDKKFAPKPNTYCYNCHFRASNAANGGGQCKF